MTGLALETFAVLPTATPEEPIALLQLPVPADDSRAVWDAASAVYQQYRLGRRVVAVACGDEDAARRLLDRLDEIGVDAASPEGGHGLVSQPVTVVPGPATCPRPAEGTQRPPLRVALAGCGVVGGGVLERLLGDPRFELVGVLVRDPHKVRDPQLPPALALTDPAGLLAREPDVVIDALSDASTSVALIRAALSRGVDVVTASKQAVASDYRGLHAQAEAHEARLEISACVGGGAPMVETVRRASRYGKVVRIEAVLNGTCNYILDRMSAGDSFEQALAGAQAAGFAEQDPTDDLSGADAAAKLSILAQVAHESLCMAEIALSGAAPRSGDGLRRQMARFDVATHRAGVGLDAAVTDPFFIEIRGEFNALRVLDSTGRRFQAKGRGAGRRPTVESVWADVVTIWHKPT